jgi:hypothetical protein
MKQELAVFNDLNDTNQHSFHRKGAHKATNREGYTKKKVANEYMNLGEYIEICEAIEQKLINFLDKDIEIENAITCFSKFITALKIGQVTGEDIAHILKPSSNITFISYPDTINGRATEQAVENFQTFLTAYNNGLLPEEMLVGFIPMDYISEKDESEIESDETSSQESEYALISAEETYTENDYVTIVGISETDLTLA